MSDDPADAQPVDLQTAANDLGVHYQTAYRWVRSGRLPARMVDGRYLVERHDLETWSAERGAPKRPTPPSAARVRRQADSVHAALLTGDEAHARATCADLVDDGLDVIDLLTEVITPALRRIGQAWADGEIDIWVEHRASSIVERTLADVVPNPRGRRRGTVVTAAITGDRHGLPTTMATVALRSSNWTVHHLGADTPEASLHAFLDDHPVDLVVLSNTNPELAASTDAVADELSSRGLTVLVGRPGSSLRDLVEQAAASRRGPLRAVPAS